jgi:hypothetical protein
MPCAIGKTARHRGLNQLPFPDVALSLYPANSSVASWDENQNGFLSS